jgi:hypothetical protein
MGPSWLFGPPKTKLGRAVWIASFVVVGGIAVGASLIDREQMIEEGRGGQQFPVVSVLYGPGMDPNGKFPLVITNPSGKPVYDVTILIFQALDFAANGRTIVLGTLYPFPNDFMRRLDLDVPLGAYAVQIRTKAHPEGFSEHLELRQDNGTIHESYYVCRPPHGYVCSKENRLMDSH